MFNRVVTPLMNVHSAVGSEEMIEDDASKNEISGHLTIPEHACILEMNRENCKNFTCGFITICD